MLFVQTETLLPLAAPCSHIKQKHGGAGGKTTEWRTTEFYRNYDQDWGGGADNDTNNNGRSREKL